MSFRRHIYLIPFSHEHHHVLLFCRRIRLAKECDISILRDYFADFYQKHLLEHLDYEDKAFADCIHNDQLKTQLEAEHRQLRDMALDIIDGQENTYDLFLKFCELLKSHLQFEEKKLFPFLEKSCSKEERDWIYSISKKILVRSHHYDIRKLKLAGNQYEGI